MQGKLIVIEGTDCSGKETQSNLLLEKLNKAGYKTVKFDFPAYNTPTGRIIGGPYLGKSHISEGWFPEGAAKVDPFVAALFYSADRRYNLPLIEAELKKGTNVILDRYTFSNMAHQGGKIRGKKTREEIYEWMYHLEFNLLKLIKPDVKVFLHVPYENAVALRKQRKEAPDQHEIKKQHLIQAERSYIEIAKKYKFSTVKCVKDGNIRSMDDINEEIYKFVIKDMKASN